MRILNKDSTGFTIVELIITIAVAALFVAAASTVVTNDTRVAERVRDQTVLNAYVENKIEELRSMGYLGVSSGTTVLTTELPAELASPKSGSLHVSEYSGGVKRAVITITFNNLGTSTTHSYTTLIGELGVGQY